MPEALGAVFPATTPQTCIVHLIRNSLDYASWNNRKALAAAAIKPIYSAQCRGGEGRATGDLLSSMHWHGSRHPAAQLCMPMHPPSGLVRWLARFSVQNQTDHPAHLLRLLVDELARVERRSRQIVASMRSRTGHGRLTFKLLPELLR